MESIENLTVKNCSEGVYIENSVIREFRRAMFEGNGHEGKINGGAVEVVGSEVGFMESVFRENIAHDGGAISFTCKSMAL